MATPNVTQVGITALQDRVIPCQFSVTGSAASGSIVNGTIYPYGLNSPINTTSFQIPAGNQYQLVDAYVSSATTPDFQLIFTLNGVIQGENYIGSTLVASNSARAKVTQPLILNPSDVFAIQIVTLAANGTAAVTITLYLQFLLVPK